MTKDRPLTAMALAVGLGFYLGYTRRASAVSAALALGRLFEDELLQLKGQAARQAVAMARELAEQSVPEYLAPKVGALMDKWMASTAIP